MREKGGFLFPKIKPDPESWLWPLKHALHQVVEFFVQDDGVTLKANHCKNCGEIYVYDHPALLNHKEE